MNQKNLPPIYKSDFLTVTLPAYAARAAIVAAQADKPLLVISGDPIYLTLPDKIGTDRNLRLYPPCPCGCFEHKRAKCDCSVEAIEAAQLAIHRNFNCVTLEAVDGFSFNRDFRFSGRVDNTAVQLAKHAWAEGYILTASDMINAVEIAVAIAALDDSQQIKAEYIAEAISYRIKH